MRLLSCVRALQRKSKLLHLREVSEGCRLGLCQYSYQIKAAFHHFKLVQAATQMHRGTRFYHGHNFLIAQLVQIFKYVFLLHYCKDWIV